MTKNSSALWIAVPLLFIGTLGAGAVHGLMSNRWGPRPNMVVAAARLERPMPERIGQWARLSKEMLRPRDQETLQCAAHLYHRYQHVETGSQISVFVIVGPHGPTAVHTPEICYSTQNHKPQGERKTVRIKDARGNTHELWDLSFTANSVEASDLRVMYAWSQGGTWQSSDRPRFQYAGAPYLYKIQLSGPPKDEASEFDACEDFLKAFLAELSQRLAEPESTIAARF